MVLYWGRRVTLAALFLALVTWAGCVEQESPTGPHSVIHEDVVAVPGYGTDCWQIAEGSDIQVCDLGTFGEFSNSWAYDVNDEGWVVGRYGEATWFGGSFFWDPATEQMEDFGLTAGTLPFLVTGTNTQRQAVGYGQAGMAVHTFLGEYVAESGTYSLADLGVPENASSSYGLAINDKGQIAGWAQYASQRAVAWSSGWSALWDGDGSESYARAQDISNEGDSYALGRMVGVTSEQGGPGQAVQWTQGSYKVILANTLGGNTSEAQAVNSCEQSDCPQIVGFAQDGQGNRRPFIWRAGQGMTELGTLGEQQDAEGTAFDINDAGDAVGESNTGSGDLHATLWPQGGPPVDLGTLPGGSCSSARAISGGGIVVGYSEVSSGVYHAAVWYVGGAGPVIPETVPEIYDALEDGIDGLVNGGALSEGQGKALHAKIDASRKLYEQGKYKGAASILQAFINQVNAFESEGILEASEAARLRELAEAAIAMMG